MRCTIIAGSPEADIDFISEQVKDCNYLICADKGYEYAKKAGAKTIGVLSGVSNEQLLLPYADCILNNIGELRNIL